MRLSHIEFVRAPLAYFKVPDQVYFEPLPKTSTAKVKSTCGATGNQEPASSRARLRAR